MDSIINPYEFLGLSSTKATLKELKEAYYRLALLCHPDKGGETSAMTVLTLAYQWVLRELTGVKDHHASFTEFYGDHIQTTPISSFTDVLADSFDYTRERFQSLCALHHIDVPDIQTMLYIPAFEWAMQRHATFETLDALLHQFLENYVADIHSQLASSNIEYYVPMSDPTGYAEQMELPEVRQEAYVKPLVVYKDPLCPDRPLTAAFIGDAVAPLSFTSITEPLPVYDYQEAFTSNIFPELPDVSPMTMEEKQLERQMQDQNLA
jgi:hypothetical protein